MEHNIKLNYDKIFKWFNKLDKYFNWFTKTKQKHMGKLKSNFNTAKNPWKLLKNRQMPIKHNKTSTLGDISTLKGGWEASPDQMLTDFKNAQTCSLNHPSCFTEEEKITLPLIRQVT